MGRTITLNDKIEGNVTHPYHYQPDYHESNRVQYFTDECNNPIDLIAYSALTKQAIVMFEGKFYWVCALHNENMIQYTEHEAKSYIERNLFTSCLKKFSYLDDVISFLRNL